LLFSIKFIRAILSVFIFAVMLGSAGWHIYLVLQQAYSARTAARIEPDPVSGWNDRLQPLMESLHSEGVVGYVSEQDLPDLEYSPGDSDEEFAMTQYFLAPIILDRGSTAHRYVIGNFSLPAGYEPHFEERLGVIVIKNYGMGIYLFEGTAP
jgi:hypothetical protein